MVASSVGALVGLYRRRERQTGSTAAQRAREPAGAVGNIKGRQPVVLESLICWARAQCGLSGLSRSVPSVEVTTSMVRITDITRRSKERPMSKPSPEQAGATADGDLPSWDQIVEDHSARVFRLAYRLTGNAHDAEDLTQEVFVRVFRSLHTYTPGTFEGWLHRITTNLFLDSARRKSRIRFDALPE